MEKHYGQILELVIRKQGVSISELARLADINRKCVYNWFHQKYLKPEIIYRVGMYINHDFSVEYPELFTKEDFQKKPAASNTPTDVETTTETQNTVEWKDKYIELLEKYNELLLKQISE